MVQLGRYGDLINLLPAFRWMAERQGKPVWVVVNEHFADLFEGVSYARAFRTGIKVDDWKEAIALAEGIWKHVIVPQRFQVNGTIGTQHYNTDQWWNCGLLDQFGASRPVFDRRDSGREWALTGLLDDSRPVVLLNLSGISSPYVFADELGCTLMEEWGRKCRVIDLTAVHCERIYDLLALMERASVLVTTDTATLHLAAATNVPVVALLNDFPEPFLASLPNCNVKLAVGYRDSVDRWFEAIHAAVGEAVGMAYGQKHRVGRYHHLVSRRREISDESSRRRVGVAVQSWQALYDRGVEPVHVYDVPRDARQVGCRRALPFFKDVLAAGLASSGGENDVIIFTNDDTVLHPAVLPVLSLQLQRAPFCCSFRNEFKAGEIPVLGSIKSWGRDLFAFKADWLKANLDCFPDYLLGTGDWDYFLSIYFRVQLGITPRKDWAVDIDPRVEIPRGYVFHEAHTPEWADFNCPALHYNRWQTAKWLAASRVPFCEVPTHIPR